MPIARADHRWSCCRRRLAPGRVSVLASGIEDGAVRLLLACLLAGGLASGLTEPARGQQPSGSPAESATRAGSAANGTKTGTLAELRQPLDNAFREQLETLAARCDQLQLPRQAAATRSWWIARDPQRQYLFLPPAEDSPAKQPLKPDAAGPDDSGGPAPGGPADVRSPAGSNAAHSDTADSDTADSNKQGQPQEDAASDSARLTQLWRRKFLDLRAARARDLFQLAGQRLTAGMPEQAFQLLHEVLREDPNHAESRRILGYRRAGAAWQKPERAVRTRSGDRNHPQFGWRRRRYWIVESEHYEIQTDHSSQAGVELADELERLVDVWQQAFFGFWAADDALRLRFAGQDVPLGPKRRFRVVLFRDHQEYLAQLGPGEPQIAKTLGYYLAGRGTAYFHAGDDSVRTTWLHEATHQLFQESVAGIRAPGEAGNFWIVEGVALYMESLRPRDGYCVLGGWDARRLQFARYRTFNERFQLPLRELVGFGRERLQQDDDIRRLYSLAAGLAHFLIDYQGGIYRPAIVSYLRDVYRGEADEDTLFQCTAREAEQLDAQYRLYLMVGDPDLAWLDRPAELTDLCFGHTQVTDQGLGLLKEMTDLQWLDVSFTEVTDVTVERLSGAARLRQLNLEQTAITDAALKTLGMLKGIEELDLSQTAVTDAGLPHLTGLSQLSVLWLTGTRVSDQGLPHLYPLKKLETLDISRSQVTQAGWRQLQQHLPGVK